MKTLTSLVAAVSLLTLLPALPAPAYAGANPNADGGPVAFCKNDVPTNFPGTPLGRCMAIQSNSKHGDTHGTVSNICNFLETNFADVFSLFYDSHADCVHDDATAILN